MTLPPEEACALLTLKSCSKRGMMGGWIVPHLAAMLASSPCSCKTQSRMTMEERHWHLLDADEKVVGAL